MYATQQNGLKHLKTVNEARLHLFIVNYGAAEITDKFKKKLLNFDGCMLPPCERELHQHVLRTSYIGNMWCNAYMSMPCGLIADNYGWVLHDGSYMFRWFEGDEIPERVGDVLQGLNNINIESMYINKKFRIICN